MKKSIKCLAAAGAFLTAMLGFAWLHYSASGGQAPETGAGMKVENPCPPDRENLQNLKMEPFVSQLPVMMLDTQGQQLMKEDTRWVKIAILDDPSGENDIFGQADMVMAATAKYRGASSYSGFDKPQYRIQFHNKEYGKPRSYPLFGMGKDSEWVLHGPFLDRTLMRNALMYRLSRETMDHAPDSRFFELFVDGSYQGVYLAVEPITDGGSRLALNQFSLLDGQTPYIVKRDRTGTESNVIHTYGEEIFRTGNELSVSYPGRNSLTEKQRLWIEEDVSRFEKALYGDRFADPILGYAAYIDVDAFVDYYILSEFSMNQDAGMLSTYAYKDIGQKLRPCVWDFNNAFDNYRWFEVRTDEFHLADRNWFDRLLQDRGFVDRVIIRYRELRQTILSDAHIAELLQQNQQVLGDAVSRNFQVWGYTFDNPLLGGGDGVTPRDPASFEEAVAQLEQVIAERSEFLDNSLEKLYEYCIN